MMSSSELIKTRFLYPGLFLLWIFYFIFKGVYLKENPLDNYEYYVICLSISTVYAVFPLRRLVLDPINREVFDKHITNTMIAVFTGNYKKSEEKPFHKIIRLMRDETKNVSERKCMDCFYRIVDNDSSLKYRSDIVRINSCIICCLADNILLSILVSLYILVSSVIFHTELLYRNVYWILALIFGISIVLLPFAIRTHLVLLERQLQYIVRHQVDIEKKPDSIRCKECAERFDLK